MKIGGMWNRVSWQPGYQQPDLAWDGEPETIGWYHSLPFGGSISVVSRMTGFGYRDEETGYRSPCGKFWLASGHYDIRDALHELDSHEAMAEWVMARANNCIASPPRRGYEHRTLDELVRWGFVQAVDINETETVNNNAPCASCVEDKPASA